MKKLFTLLTLLFPFIISAQENNYWNIQYGTRSTLLGGAVIGSVSDLSATFYNPGAIALFPDVKFLLSAQVYQFDKYTVKNGAAEGKDLDYTSIVPSPNFAAYDFAFNFLGDDRLVISILTRQNGDVEFATRIIDSLEVIDSSPGKEFFAAGLNIEKKFNDIWGGITYSSRLSNTVGVGVTTYISYRNFTSSSITVQEALKGDGSIASYSNIIRYKFNNCRILLKGGVGFNLSPLTFGLTVTTPSLNIFGNGSVGTHLFTSGIDPLRFESNFQDEVKSKFNSSWAIGAGGAYRIDAFKVHLSAEWYDKIKRYLVLDTEPYAAQSSGEILSNDLSHEAKSVINFGVGMDYYANEDLIFSLSIVNDNSAYQEGSTTNLAPYNVWDLIHFAGGSSFKVGKSNVTVGLAYAFGSQFVQNKINIGEVDNNSERTSEIKYSHVKVLFGFEF